MPKVNKTKEQRFEETKKRWDEAERGTLGLRLVRFFDFDDLPNTRKIELLTEPTILTSDGVESLVMMTIENYAALAPPRGVNGRQAKTCIIKGVLFREVI